MKVLLRDDVKGVGRRGDIVDVKSGFARNFLLPSGAAVKASTATETQASSMRRSR
ncbi:MAG TPA: bL9 family ribosomal protein, partial [Acidimicrobiales bacterium]|nr:bL9 family ribosomal protein [Acidimicrobiales bacterium]